MGAEREPLREWGPINDQWLLTAIVRIPRELWPTGLRLGDTVEAVVREYEAIRRAGGTPASPAAALSPEPAGEEPG